MRAIVIKEYGPVEGLVYQELPEPEAEAGHVVIEIKAFSLNHAEMPMRRGEWAESMPVSGIECVGVVKFCPAASSRRSEEHTSELQSLMRISYAVFCLKTNNHNII